MLDDLRVRELGTFWSFFGSQVAGAALAQCAGEVGAGCGAAVRRRAARLPANPVAWAPSRAALPLGRQPGARQGERGALVTEQATPMQTDSVITVRGLYKDRKSVV